MLKFRHFLTVGIGTSVSRVLGFVRDVAIAAALGAGPVADAFVVAFRLPNLFRRVFTEGAFNAAFIPAYKRRLAEQGEDAAEDFAGEVFSLSTLAAIILTTLMMVLSGWLVVLLAPGFEQDSERFLLARDFLRLALPYLPLTMAFAVIAAMLNAHQHFGAMAFAPNVMNVIMIVAMLPFVSSGNQYDAQAGWALAIAVTLGGIAQLVIVALALRRAGLHVRFQLPYPGNEMKQLFARAFSGVVASSLAQINMLVATFVASQMASAVSWLYYADRVYQLPLGIVSVAIGVVLLPAIADKSREGALSEVNEAVIRALELAWLLTLPAAFALFIIAEPICDVLFRRGAFSIDDAHATAGLLRIFGLSLPWLVSIKVMNSAFFAREDTRIPFLATLAGIVLNIVLAYGLFRYQGVEGIALASVFSAMAAAFILGFCAHKQLGLQFDRRHLLRFGGILIASLTMALVLVLLLSPLAPWLGGAVWGRIGGLFVLVVCGLASYGALVAAFGLLRRSALLKP